MMHNKKRLYHFPKRMVCMSLAVVMALSTALTGCGAASTTVHALDDDHDHSGTSEVIPDETAPAERVSDDTISLREMLSDNLDDKLADQAADVSADYWENEVPANDNAALMGMGLQIAGDEVDVKTGSSTDIDKAKAETVEKKYDENGLRQLNQYVEIDYTTVNKNALTVDNLTDLFSKNPEAFISDSMTYQPVYEVKGYDDAYVAFVDATSVNGVEGELISHTIVSGTIINPVDENDHVVFDQEKGILYIPKSLYFTGEGEEYDYGLAMQLMVAVDTKKTEKDEYGNILANVSVDVENDRGVDINTKTGTYSMVGFEFVVLDITSPENADQFTADDFSVYLHGSTEPLDSDELFWNKSTGNLTIKSQAMVTSDVKLVVEKQTLLKSVGRFFGVNATSASADEIREMEDVDGMTPVTNVDTKKWVCPSIDLDKVHVGDIYGTGKDESDGRSASAIAAPMLAAGLKDYMYIPNSHGEAADLYMYLTRNGGQEFDNDDPNCTWQANIESILKRVTFDTMGNYEYDAVNSYPGFIMRAPYRDMTNTSHPDPILLYSDYDTVEFGEMVYFGKQADWRWIENTEGVLPNDWYATYFVGRCTHRDGNLLGGDTGEIEEGQDARIEKSNVSARIDEPRLFATAVTPPPPPGCPNCSCCLQSECPGESCTKDGCPCSRVECKGCGDIFPGNEVNSSTGNQCKRCNELDGALTSGKVPTPTVVSILAITDKYMILGMTMTNFKNDGSVANNKQVGTCIFKLMIESRLTVTKTASNTVNDGTLQNSCYADPGTAIYGVYEKKGDLSSKVGEITANGKEELKLRPDTYYVHEIQAPLGFYPDNTGGDNGDGWYTVEATNGDVNLDVTDEPMVDPGMLILQKAADQRTNAGILTGNLPSFEGIEFEVSYYKGEYTSIDALKNVAPDEKAIFQTDRNGFLRIDTRHLKNGQTWKYVKADGVSLTFPLGTVYIKEKTPITGMKLTASLGSLTVYKDTSNKTDMSITQNTYQPVGTIYATSSQKTDADVSYENTVWKGGVSVVKSDAGRDASNPQGDATLEGAEYTIYNKSRNSVMFKGKEVAVNAEVTKITTKYDATSKTYLATTGNSVLEYGTYQIVETKAPTGYNNSNWTQTFTIDKDGQMHQFIQKSTTASQNGVNWLKRWCTDQVMTGGVTVVKADKDWARSEAEGDATLEGTVFTIYNRSKTSILYQGKEIAKDAVVTTISTKYDANAKAYVATTGNNALAYGTYEIMETTPPTGYHPNGWKQTFTIRSEGEMKNYTTQAEKWSEDAVFRGGVTVVKADKDWEVSDWQGDATLEGAEFTIYNKSKNNVMYKGKEIAVDGVVDVISTKFDSATNAYVATTGASTLAYGTYQIVETKAPTGYNLADWSQTFTIREEGQMHNYNRTESADSQNGLNWIHRWCVDPVMRGRVIIGKVDRETRQYTPLGAASLAGTHFNIINRSKHPVYVDGTTYAVGEVVDNITTAEMEVNGRTVIAAIKESLPYGTYEIKETATGIGYLFDTNSKNQTTTFSIRNEGETIDLTGEDDAFTNQVQREDFYFQKKANDSGKEMPKVAWTMTSVTTGETHVIVTDENGKYDSEFADHTVRTNSNDPDSPISNGAIGIDEHGHYYVADSEKLDYDAGTWFTGLKPEMTEWGSDGKTYTVVGGTGHVAIVNDTLRAFPYDTYVVQELASDANEEYNLVSFTVVLKRYSKDPDSNGIKIDYGTVDDEHVDLYTNLGYNATGFGATAKSAPAVGDLTVTDTVNYSGITAHGEYVMKGALHLVDNDGNDEGVVATNEVTFEAKASGQLKMDFNLDASAYAGKRLVATQEIWQGEKLLNEEKDLTNEDQMVWLAGISATRADKIYKGIDLPITVTDEIDYVNLEIGSLYTIKMTVVDQETGEVILDKDGNEVAVEKMFVPGTNSGTTSISLTFDGQKDLRNRYGVVFEEITKGVVYSEHKDLNDTDQTVWFADMIDTYAANAETSGKNLPAKADQSVLECISLRDMKESRSYKIDGSIYWLDENGNANPLLDSESEQIVKTIEGPGEKESMTFDGIDAEELEGRNLVVYQTLYMRAGESDEWELAFEHCDNEDEDQMVYIPKIDTELVAANGIHNTDVSAETVLTDRVDYQNLIPGLTYTATGTLHIRADEEVELPSVPADDKNKADTPADGEEAGNEAEAQSDNAAEETPAEDEKPADTPADETPVTNYKAVDLGEIESVVASAEFTAEEPNGSVEVVFTYDASDLDGKVVVAFEELYLNETPQIPDKWAEFFKNAEVAPAAEADETDAPEEGTQTGKALLVAEHKDIADTAQSVGFAKIKSTTLTSEKGIHERAADGEATLTDVVEYEALIPGFTYHVTGTLMVHGEHDEGESLMTVEKDFVPESVNGSMEMTYTFDSSELGGKTVTAYEVISYNDVRVAGHEDIKDEGQSVHFIGIDTVFTGAKESLVVSNDGVIEDTPDAEKPAEDTETPAEDAEKPAEDTETPVEDAEKPAEDTETPAEDAEKPETSARRDRAEDASVKDTESEKSAEDAEKPEKPAEDADDVNKPTTGNDGTIDEVVDEVTADKGAIKRVEFNVYQTGKNEDGSAAYDIETVDIVDAIHLTNLTKGNTYTLTGEVHRKAEDGSDAGVMAADGLVTFTADSTDMILVSVFHVNMEKAESADLVAFQSLYDVDGNLVGIHADIADPDQTVTAEPNVVKNPCGCDEPDCKHKDEKDHCVNNPGCCDDSDCCDDCDVCEHKPVMATVLTGADGSKTPAPSEAAEFTDILTYDRLKADTEYTVKGELHVINAEGEDEGVIGNAEQTFKTEAKAENPADKAEDTDQTEEPADKAEDADKTEEPVDKTEDTETADEDKKAEDAEQVEAQAETDAETADKTEDTADKADDADNKAEDTDPADKAEDTDQTEDSADEAEDATQAKNTVEVHFTGVDTSKLEGKKVVCYEFLYLGETLVGSHEDPNDKDQTVVVTRAKNPCGCDDPDCKHKDEKDHCVDNPGCCDDSDCCKDCDQCKHKNPCGCDDPDCKHKDEKDHCVNNPGCCDDSDCCKDCDQCKHKNPCGCDDPDCKHKDEKDHCVNNPGCCDDSDCCKDCDDCKHKNPCGCDDPNCKHKDEKDHCVNNPGCCDDSDCCKDCDDCKPGKNPCGCDDPDCKHKDEKDHCKDNPGCCDDSDCCKDCDDCKPGKNPCGCDDPNCKHKDEKDHCKKPGCCDDSDCCKDCDDCKPGKNPCGCDDPNCKHKDEKDHCVNNPGCCDDSDCCKDCDDCKPAKNACGCDDPNCKHKDEKNHCVNNPGCCDDANCCKNCDDCEKAPAKANACGCSESDCKYKNVKDHCVNNPGCCDDASCCKNCSTCKKAPAKTETTTKTPEKTTIEKVIETIKTGQNLFLLTGILGLAIMSGGGYFFFAKTASGRDLARKIRKKLSELFGRK